MKINEIQFQEHIDVYQHHILGSSLEDELNLS